MVSSGLSKLYSEFGPDDMIWKALKQSDVQDVRAMSMW